jgi:hypothetical protein
LLKQDIGVLLLSRRQILLNARRNLAMENNWNYEDPMDEIYAIRRMISERYGHDVRRIAAAARERMKREEAEGSRIYLHLPSARIASTMV